MHTKLGGLFCVKCFMTLVAIEGRMYIDVPLNIISYLNSIFHLRWAADLKQLRERSP